jgi:hypothetical protein
MPAADGSYRAAKNPRVIPTQAKLEHLRQSSVSEGVNSTLQWWHLGGQTRHVLLARRKSRPLTMRRVGTGLEWGGHLCGLRLGRTCTGPRRVISSSADEAGLSFTRRVEDERARELRTSGRPLISGAAR